MDDKNIYYFLGLVTQLGLVMVCSILVGVGIGVLIDRKAGTGQLFTMIFMILGIIAGFWGAYKMIIKKVK